jgi:hypothetical protein
MSNLVVARYKGNAHFIQTWQDIASVADAQGHLVAVIAPVVTQPEFKAVEMAKLIGAAASGDTAQFPQRFTLTQTTQGEYGGVLCVVVDEAGTDVFTLSSVKSLSYLSALFDKLNGR